MTRAYHCGHCGAVGHGKGTCPTSPEGRAKLQAAAAALAAANGDHRLAGATLGVSRQRVDQIVASRGLEGLSATLRFAGKPTPAERKKRAAKAARKRMNARVAQWRAEGKCPVGGCERTDERVVCPKHRAERSAYRKARYRRCVAASMCPRCPNQATAGQTYCAACLGVFATYNRSRS